MSLGAPPMTCTTGEEPLPLSPSSASGPSVSFLQSSVKRDNLDFLKNALFVYLNLHTILNAGTAAARPAA
jgi:hypothetical protein